ncbi:unnamed protein product [Amoebophrya sp. A25]|nr:unnamed protein product [Amoebophrya sp. A25]|eukprot:GSA25T00013699001.1
MTSRPPPGVIVTAPPTSTHETPPSNDIELVVRKMSGNFVMRRRFVPQTPLSFLKIAVLHALQQENESLSSADVKITLVVSHEDDVQMNNESTDVQEPEPRHGVFYTSQTKAACKLPARPRQTFGILFSSSSSSGDFHFACKSRSSSRCDEFSFGELYKPEVVDQAKTPI